MRASILIADDYEDNRELLRLLLESANYIVREARDGQECLRLAREQQPDIALIDLSMPVLDGWNVLREMRADDGMKSITCVAVTAFAADDDRRQALNAGFDAYLSKPYRAQDLLDLMNDLLAARTINQI